MLKTSTLALNKNEELRLPTCKGTRGQSPGRSTGPSRWRPLWTGKAHTAAWWSGRRHWWLCETSAGENLTWKSSSLSLFTKKMMKVGLKTLCCLFVSVSGDLWRSSLCCWEVFQAKLRISCGGFCNLEQRKSKGWRRTSFTGWDKND